MASIGGYLLMKSLSKRINGQAFLGEISMKYTFANLFRHSDSMIEYNFYRIIEHLHLLSQPHFTFSLHSTTSNPSNRSTNTVPIYHHYLKVKCYFVDYHLATQMFVYLHPSQHSSQNAYNPSDNHLLNFIMTKYTASINS